VPKSPASQTAALIIAEQQSPLPVEFPEHLVSGAQVGDDLLLLPIHPAGGPIPWPIAKTDHGAKSLVVYKGLAEAVRRESNQAICHWYGLTPQTISKWRRILGVPSTTEGTRRLRHEYALEPAATAARAKAHAKAADPERRRKIAEAKRGKPRPPGLIARLTAARLAKPVSDETRQKMSETHKKRGTRPPWIGPPWTPEEDDLVRRLSATEAAERTGRTLEAVYSRRRILGVKDGRRRER
jgi:hypothetical protein